MAYRHNDSFHKHQVAAHRTRKLAFFSVLAVVLVLSVIGVDYLINRLSNNDSVVSREVTSTVQSANVSVYRSEYFQFQAPSDWVLVSSLTTDNKFVYVKNKGNLVTQRLVVYIDRPEDKRVDQNIAYLLPVEINSLGSFVPIGTVTEHCDESWPKSLKRNPDRIEHEGVLMECTPNTREYNVMVGKVGGSDRIPVELSSGDEVNMTLVFSDLTAYPGAGDLYSIVSSFSTL